MENFLEDITHLNDPYFTLYHVTDDSDVKSVKEWVQCMEKEKGSMICKTIKNNNYYEYSHNK